jgi:arsenite methyltransferase
MRFPQVKITSKQCYKRDKRKVDIMDFKMRDEVRKQYGEIAAKVSSNSGKAGCGPDSSCIDKPERLSVGYTEENLNGLPEDAVSASLGCANPLLFAKLKEGETVLDLGSGGGIDVLAASKYVGKSGKVYGLDMTDEMLALSNKNKAEMGAGNVEFLKGYIEDIPLKDNVIDVIMSNCVINLSEDKEKALSEAYRVLKEGGRIAVSDIVSLKSIPAELKKQVEMWCGCLAGTIEVEEYIRILENVGFKNIEIEPVIVFTKQIVEALSEMFGDLFNTLIDINLDEVEGAFASAHIKAVK